MIEIKNLTKSYGGRKVLDIENVQFKNNEIVSIMGHNGSGKSTLGKILAGIIQSDTGEILGLGETLYLNQHCLPFNKTVKKNLLYGLKGDKKEKEEKCQKILSDLNIAHLGDKNAKKLSGGEVQRLCIARLLVRDCSLLILDEPCSATDSEATTLIEKAICEYQKRVGCIVILITHSEEQARRISNRIIRISDGKIQGQEIVNG